MDEAAQHEAVERYDSFNGKVVKFVPASGAASRMFKDLFEGRDDLLAGKTLEEGSKAHKFVDSIDRFAFYSQEDFAGLSDFQVIDHVIGQGLSASGNPGLDYGNRPKGQVLFHRYDGEVRTAFEEHLVEGALYAAAQMEWCIFISRCLRRIRLVLRRSLRKMRQNTRSVSAVGTMSLSACRIRLPIS